MYFTPIYVLSMTIHMFLVSFVTIVGNFRPKGAFTRSNIRDDFSVLYHDDFSDLNQNVLFDVHTAA